MGFLGVFQGSLRGPFGIFPMVFVRFASNLAWYLLNISLIGLEQKFYTRAFFCAVVSIFVDDVIIWEYIGK